VSVQATVSPARVGIGDPFQYVVVARAAHVAADSGPFEQVRPASVQHDGGTVRIVQTLVCVDRGCAPDDTARRVVLPAPRADGVAGTPAAVTVVPRVQGQAVAAPRATYREQTQIPAPAVQFGLVAAALAVAAVVLVAAAVSVLLLPRRRTVAGRRTVDLAAALRLLRESAGRPVADRRRASDLVARLARSEDATRLAWAPTEPQPAEVEQLADRIGGAP
jgi:hypothetical protein